MIYLGQRAEPLLPKKMFNFFARDIISKSVIELYELLDKQVPPPRSEQAACG
jgi:hypothetical protein